MSAISFYNDCDRLVALNAGASFNDGSFGEQIRPINKPVSPANLYQAIRKGKFAFLSIAWRGLSDTDRNTFISAAGSLPMARSLFIAANINLILIRQPLITSYVPSSVPVDFPIAISGISLTEFLIMASGSPATVPAGHTLLILATYQKEPQKIFSDPANYSPVAYFPAGTDLSTDTDIITSWKDYFGELTVGKRICIKAVLINDSNGLRGGPSFSCATASAAINYYILDSTSDFLTDELSNFLTYPNH